MFRTRCEIAHGDLHSPDVTEANKCINFVIQSIDDFKSQIEFAADNQMFLKPAHRRDPQASETEYSC